MKTVLMVCVGNICRSPMAQALLASACPGLQVISAGVGALSGRPADLTAQELMARRNIDISAHRAQQINSALAQQADLILVMDQEQRRYVRDSYPFASGKVFRLGEFSKMEIPDPYTKPREAFERSLSMISLSLDAWINRINAL